MLHGPAIMMGGASPPMRTPLMFSTVSALCTLRLTSNCFLSLASSRSRLARKISLKMLFKAAAEKGPGLTSSMYLSWRSSRAGS